ncbi:PEGA domain-containing protein [Candidatus Berkelbacteria bacterium]|nr:PEGA domain-containing protein [Candidatus Berkelbacteria bacterium]
MRRILPWFWRLVLITGFFILAGVVIIEARGWRFDPRNLRFVQTGMLVVRYQPPDATLLVDAELIDHASPTVLPNLLPGRYNLELRKSGYASWTKTVSIEPERVVAELSLVLFTDQPVVEQIVDPDELVRVTALFASAFNSEQTPSIHNQVELWNNDLLITRLSSPVQSVQWLIEDSVIIFQQGKLIRIISVDGTNDRTIYQLASDTVAPMIVEHRGQSIVTKNDQGVVRITIR